MKFMEAITFVYMLLSPIIELFVLWISSKYLKFKRNRFIFAFLSTAILFVISSTITFIFYFIQESLATIIIRVAISIFVLLPIWFYIIMKVYRVLLKDAFRMFGLLIIASLIIGFVIMIPLSLILHFSGIETAPKEKSCEEKYSSFPLSMLDEQTKKQDLLTCLTNKAIDENNSSICKETSDESSCYSRYAISKSDETFCKMVSEEGEYFCYYRIARDKNDDSICDNLPEESHLGDISTCKFNVNLDIAVSQNNIDYCTSIKIDWRKDICYIKFAKARLDESICNRIEHEEYNSISECIESVNKWKQFKDEGRKLPQDYWI